MLIIVQFHNSRNFSPVSNNNESFSDINLDSIPDADLGLKGLEKSEPPCLVEVERFKESQINLSRLVIQKYFILMLPTKESENAILPLEDQNPWTREHLH